MSFPGTQLLIMLGGARFVEPERAALLLMLWRQFLQAYQPTGPAEYMLVAMAVLSFDHWLRLNTFVGNVQARLEGEMFGQPTLTTTGSRASQDPSLRDLTVSQLVEQLGRNVLPLLDRLNRLVIRNLRALRDVKGGPLSLVVANYGQVNVGQTQTNTVQPANVTLDAGRAGRPAHRNASERPRKLGRTDRTRPQ